MALETYPLWLGPKVGDDVGPPMGAQQYRQIIDLLFSEGIIDVAAGQFRVTPSSGFVLAVAPGAYIIDGDDVTGQGAFFGRNLSPGDTVTIPAAPASNSRIDRVVIKINDAESTGLAMNNAQLLVVQGTAAASPVAPAIPNSAIPLARVTVAAGTSTITTAMLTDDRTQSGSSGYGPQAVPLTTAQRTALTNVGVGYQVFDTTLGKLFVYGGSSLGWLSGASLNVQTFNASGTWTKPSGASLVFVDVVSGGGGGGCGQNQNGYGTGGGGGGRRREMLQASTLASSVSVQVGAAGAGAPLGSTAQAGSGGQSSFGNYAVTGGVGGQHSGQYGPLPVGGRVSAQVAWAQYDGGNGGAPLQSQYTTAGLYGAGGGGNGGASNAAGNPGGGSGEAYGGAGGAVGNASVNPTAGSNGTTTLTGAGTGGGGGGGTNTNNSTTGYGAAGGNGGFPGGGGGGSGYSYGQNSAKGGDGAAGQVVVITLCV